MPTALRKASAFLTLALRGRLAWDVQARHSLRYALRRLTRRWEARRLDRAEASARRAEAWQIHHEAEGMQ